MKRFFLAAGLCHFFLASPAFAQVSIGITFDAPPPVIEVSPGIEVVQDYDGDDIFFSDGFYWVSRNDGWYRTNNYQGGWVVVANASVPVFIRESPPGHFHHWNAAAQHSDTRFQAHYRNGIAARSGSAQTPAAIARAPIAAKRPPQAKRAVPHAVEAKRPIGSLRDR